MGKVVVLIMIFLLFVIAWSLPLYVCVNLFCWLFHLSFRITLIQAYGVSLLIQTIYHTFFKKESK